VPQRFISQLIDVKQLRAKQRRVKDKKGGAMAKIFAWISIRSLILLLYLILEIETKEYHKISVVCFNSAGFYIAKRSMWSMVVTLFVKLVEHTWEFLMDTAG
jgi:hypothetical protein